MSLNAHKYNSTEMYVEEQKLVFAKFNEFLSIHIAVVLFRLHWGIWKHEMLNFSLTCS